MARSVTSNGHLPVFIHDCEDLATFRLFSSQLVINGNATQSQISRATANLTSSAVSGFFSVKGTFGFLNVASNIVN